MIDRARAEHLRHQLALEAAGIGYWDWDLITDRVEWDARCFEMLGYPVGAFAVSYQRWSELLHVEDVERTQTEVQRQLERGDAFVIEFRMRKADGSWLWVEGRGRTMACDANGSPTRMLGTHADITARKEAEATLRMIADLQSDFIASHNMQARFAQVLEQCAELTGSSFGFIGEVLHHPDGRHCLKTFALTGMAHQVAPGSAPDCEEAGPLLAATLAGSRTLVLNDGVPAELAAFLPHGHPSLHNLITLPLRYAGSTVALIGLANRPGGYDHRIADLLQPLLGAAGNVIAANRARRAESGLQDDLREKSDALARSNADLEQFAYVASHDLRQPLRMIHSYVQILEDDLHGMLGDEQREIMRFIREGTLRMDKMLIGLLEYSRVGRGGEPLKPVSVRAALDEALLFLVPQIEHTRALIDISGSWPTLTASENELVRLFQNLLDNALKYRQPQVTPHISVTAEAVAGGWRFSIRDNGIGIESTEQAERLFKVFQRLHGRSRYDGDGIGLALCRRIVERHGGRIGVRSEGAGRGCCFSFLLPGSRDESGAFDC
ncbi:PAS domain-containing protein [Thauera sp. CAU 1555]|uniref:histidine kinase n=1 Tax=Thauera sedimentorum TaxID=2767595 RepID=A0ABR9B658_9RHOO|nr:ATP-binding protein [Thauera sedimentorum]MBC9070934.1 PAS domain-containing protein [Thauera sedimentorum]MBD8501853.1 PAS domain-containing protein [Thauera sedimentorum]